MHQGGTKRCLILLALWLPGMLAAHAPTTADDPASTIALVKKWLRQPSEQREPLADLAWAKLPLSQAEADQARELLWQDHLQAWQAKYKEEWERKQIQVGQHVLRFDYRLFGDPHSKGRSMFISMHGGGSVSSRVNDQQWQNQIRLYQPKEGLYVAPRAPTDAWNMWFQPHMDALLDQLIRHAVAFAQVDPNRVYLMGYSAGGDGVYQLAPRMADRWAAASMMAGHPNDASPNNLRNLPFTIHVGGRDGAFNRNKVAEEWGEKLAALHKADPQGYIHELKIHKDRPHWMNLQDAEALPWMMRFDRNPKPKRVIWRQAMVTQPRFYWLAVEPEQHKPADEITASVDGQTVTVLSTGRNLKQLRIRFDDHLVDLNQPVTVVTKGERELFSGKVRRTVLCLFKTLQERGDPNYSFPAEIEVDFSRD